MPHPLACLVILSAAAFAGAADDWPQFRGPGGQGHAASSDLPLTWSETQNVTWKTPLPGQGWSSPVIGGGKVWMTTALGKGTSLRALAVDLATGKLAIDVEVFKPEALQPIHAQNSWASPTPVIEGDRVYVSFGAYGTACLDAATGKALWTNTEAKIQHANGPGSTPILHGDRLFLCCDGIDVQYQIAFDKRTGTVAWKADRSQVINKEGDRRKAYATPLVTTIDGVEQLISPAAEWLYAYAPATGKELWRLHYPGYSNVPRPVHGLGLLFVCTGFDKPEVWAIKPGGSGELGAGAVVWKSKASAPAQCSPVLVGERLYFINEQGIATCVDAATGKEQWKERLGAACSASPMAAGNRIYFSDRDGTTTVVDAASPAFKVLAKNKLADGCMASLAVAGNSIVLRTKSALYRIEAK